MKFQMLGHRITERRKELKLSQEDVANALNLSVSHYGNIERGYRAPSLELFINIANFFYCDADSLLCDFIKVDNTPIETESNFHRMFFFEERRELEVSEEEPSCDNPAD